MYDFARSFFRCFCPAYIADKRNTFPSKAGSLSGFTTLSLFALIMISGCVSLGTRTLPENVNSIYIPYVKNETMEPGVEEEVTDALVREFIKDGRLKVLPYEEAETVLEGYVSKYEISPQQQNAAGRTISYYVDIKVTLSVKDLRTAEIILPPTTFSEGGIYFLSNLPGKRRHSEILARLGEDVISRLIEGW